MSELFLEIRYALRLAHRAPAMVAVITGSLTLGIGANTAFFSFVNAIQFKPLPFADEATLVDVSEWSATELCAGCGVGTSLPYQFDIGYDSSRVLVADITLSDARYDFPGAIRTFASSLVESLERIPSVRAAVSRSIFFRGFGGQPARLMVDGIGEAEASGHTVSVEVGATSSSVTLFTRLVRTGSFFGSCPPPLGGSVAPDERRRGLAGARQRFVRAEAGELEVGR